MLLLTTLYHYRWISVRDNFTDILQWRGIPISFQIIMEWHVNNAADLLHLDEKCVTIFPSALICWNVAFGKLRMICLEFDWMSQFQSGIWCHNNWRTYIIWILCCVQHTNVKRNFVRSEVLFYQKKKVGVSFYVYRFILQGITYYIKEGQGNVKGNRYGYIILGLSLLN